MGSADRTRVANWTIGVGLDSDADISQALSSLKSKFQAALNDIQRASAQVDLFAGLSDSVKSASDALAKAKQDVTNFAGALAAAKDAGKDVTTDLEKKLVSAQQAVKTTTSEFNKQVDAISRVENQLTKAGVDTANMTSAQLKLATATAEATEALTLQSAKGLLGLKTLGDVTPQITALTAAFTTLKNSGKLSATEIAQAERQLDQQTETLLGSVTNLPGTFEKAGKAGVSAFEAIGGKTLIALAGIATVAEAIKTVATNSIEFVQGLGKIGTVSTATDTQLEGLGESARRLARTLGIDVNDALKALYELIRSTNLGPDDALTVLDASARAAKASFTDLNVVTKVSGDLISAFGLRAGDVSKVLDALFASAKTGGPAFTDLAGGIGSLGVVAKSAGLSVQDMSALLNVMSSASGDSAGSVTELQKILIKFNTDQVRAQLRAMGIVSTDLVSVLKELAARGADLNVLLDLGAASTKSAVGVTALTRSTSDLDEALARAASSLGTVADGLERVDKLPKDGIDRLVASLKNFAIKSEIANDIGGVADALARFINIATEGAEDFDRLVGGVKETRKELDLFRDSEAKGFAKTLTEDAQAAAKVLADLAASIAEARTKLGGIGAELTADVKALNDLAAQQIATIGKAADEQIAALDRSSAAATKTAQQTVDIQTKANADILKIISDNAKEVARVTDEAIVAREAALRKTKATEEQIQTELAKLRLASIAATVADYQKFYDTLIAQSQAYAAKIRAIEDGRLAYQQSIDAKIFDLRLGAVDEYGKKLVSVYDQDVARAREADRLISLSREAALRGDVTLAQKYADQAIAQGDKLVAAYDEDGKLIIGQDQVQQKQLQILQGAAESVGIAYGKQAEAAKAGLTSTNETLATVKGKLDDILKVQKDAQAIAKEGLDYKVRIDEIAYDEAKAKLDALTAPRTVSVTVKMEGDPGFVNYTPVETRAAGGYVSKAIQGFAAGGPTFGDVVRYAGGGSVFRPPTWNKVPGVGNEDTVPALLNAGSFVMKKAASQFYGDGLMTQLAQGYAGGGTVDLNALRQSLQDAQDSLVLLKRHADLILNPLIDGARTLPRSQFGENYADALQIIRDLISASTSASDVSALLNPIEQSATGIAAAIDAAHQNHVPLVFGISATGEQGGVFGQNAPSGLYQQLVAKMRTQRFAGGGYVDSVPAMLTPGEYVVNPLAVRMFGGGFLDALNNMQVPKGFLDGIMNVAPPRRFANGGYVDGPGAPMMAAAQTTRSPLPPIIINVQRLSEDELNRTVLPWFNKTVRNSR